MGDSAQGVSVRARQLVVSHMLTPGAFWAREACKKDKLESLEADINKVFSHIKVQGFHQPCEDELIGVFDVRLGRWVRGRVERWQEAGGEVFLVDYGRTLPEVRTVHPLPQEARELPPQAFQVFLDGVLPLTNVYDYKELKFKLVVAESWMPAASSKVKQMLAKSHGSFFQQTRTWKGVSLGTLYLSFPNDLVVSLGENLCEADLALSDQQLFLAEMETRVSPLVCAKGPPPPPLEDGGETILSLTNHKTNQDYLEENGKTNGAENGEEDLGNLPPRLTSCGRGLQMQHLKGQQKEVSQPGVLLEGSSRLPAQPSQPAKVQFIPAGQLIKPQAAKGRVGNSSVQASMLSQMTGSPLSHADSSCFIVNNDRLMKSPCPVKSPDCKTSSPTGSPPEKVVPGKWPVHPTGPPPEKTGAGNGPVQPLGPPRAPQATHKGADSQATPSFSSSTHSSSSAGGEWRPQLMEMTRQTQLPVLVRGSDLSKPLDSISAAPLHGDVHKALERLGCRGITNQQRHMWPAVLRGQNVVSVGPQESGKTLGFVAPLASNMLDMGLYSELKKSNGPLVLVLCSNAEKACITDSWFRRLTRNEFKDWEFSQNRGFQETQPRVKTVLTYGGGAENEKMMELMNGCQVLISTPPCLLRMLAYWEGVVTDFDRLCHLVFDDADILFEKFNPQVTKILEMCKASLGVSWRKERSLQIIATARCWTPAVEQFARRVPPDPTVIVSTGLEVLACCKLPPSIHRLADPSDRCRTVADIVRPLAGRCKAVVVCCSAEEALQLSRFLETLVPCLLVAAEKMDRFTVTRVCEKWTYAVLPGSLPLLVVTDAVLPEMDLFDASLLVNFSMPLVRSVFSLRIACILNQCPDSLQEDAKGPQPAVHILLGEKDSLQIPALVELLKRMKASLPEGLEEKGKEVARLREEMKIDSPLCPNLCNFGACLLQASCIYRHALVQELDESPPHLPRSGDVTLKVLHVLNATHFAARLEQHTSEGGKTSSLQTKEHLYLPIDMSEFFDKQSNSNGLNSEMHEIEDPDENLATMEEGELLPDSEMVAVEDLATLEEGELIEDHDDDMATLEEEELIPKDQVPVLGGKTGVVLDEEMESQEVSGTHKSGDSKKTKTVYTSGNFALVEVIGDLFSAAPSVSFAHCVAEDFCMSKGVALRFRDTFGNMGALKSQRRKTGEVAVLRTEHRFVFYLVTRRVTSYTCKPTLADLQRSLKELKELCVKHDVKNLAIPKIGKGNNQLRWKDVRKSLEDIFNGVNLTITVYNCVLVEVKGTVFYAAPFCSLAHCVAADFKMTQGVARKFREKFGNVDLLMNQGKQPGKVAVLKHEQRFVFYLVTKHTSTSDSKPTLSDMESCLKELRECCLQLQVRNLAIPKIGSGIDQLNWGDVRVLIEDIFADLEDLTITVYDNEDWTPPVPRKSASSHQRGSPSNVPFYQQGSNNQSSKTYQESSKPSNPYERDYLSSKPYQESYQQSSKPYQQPSKPSNPYERDYLSSKPYQQSSNPYQQPFKPSNPYERDYMSSKPYQESYQQFSKPSNPYERDYMSSKPCQESSKPSNPYECDYQTSKPYQQDYQQPSKPSNPYELDYQSSKPYQQPSKPSNPYERDYQSSKPYQQDYQQPSKPSNPYQLDYQSSKPYQQDYQQPSKPSNPYERDYLSSKPYQQGSGYHWQSSGPRRPKFASGSSSSDEDYDFHVRDTPAQEAQQPHGKILDRTNMRYFRDQ